MNSTIYRHPDLCIKCHQCALICPLYFGDIDENVIFIDEDSPEIVTQIQAAISECLMEALEVLD